MGIYDPTEDVFFSLLFILLFNLVMPLYRGRDAGHSWQHGTMVSRFSLKLMMWMIYISAPLVVSNAG